MKRGASLVLAVAVLVGSGAWLGSSLPLQGQAPPAKTSRVQELTSYRDVVKRVLPAVVSIESRSKPAKAAKATRNPLPDDSRVPEEFRRFFESLPSEAEETPKQGFGSGFFIDAKGTILTNFHVVDGAEQVTVTLQDGRKFQSSKIRGDKRTDLAIVVLEGKGDNFPYLELDDSDQYEIGDRVLAVGAPFGLTGSVTHGIVSGKGRTGLSLNMYEDFIQTDAAINPGNSGGPLVGLDGKVVGINAAIKSRSGGFQGVGLAVASNLARNVVKSLTTEGVVRRGYLGVQIRELNDDVAKRLGLENNVGVVVGDVFEKTPAAKAGLLSGDIITSIAGKAVRDGRTVQMAVAGLPIGQAAPFEVYRDGKKQTVDVTIEEQPQEFGSASVPAPRPSSTMPESVSISKAGIEVADLTEDLARSLGYRNGQRGAIITKVERNSAASEAGLRPGMLIVRVENKAVGNATTAQQMLTEQAVARGALLQVQSPQGGTNFVILKAS